MKLPKNLIILAGTLLCLNSCAPISNTYRYVPPETDKPILPPTEESYRFEYKDATCPKDLPNNTASFESLPNFCTFLQDTDTNQNCDPDRRRAEFRKTCSPNGYVWNSPYRCEIQISQLQPSFQTTEVFCVDEDSGPIKNLERSYTNQNSGLANEETLLIQIEMLLRLPVDRAASPATRATFNTKSYTQTGVVNQFKAQAAIYGPFKTTTSARVGSFDLVLRCETVAVCR